MQYMWYCSITRCTAVLSCYEPPGTEHTETSPCTWWSAAGPDEPPPSWLSVIWRFIKVRGSRHARVNGGFFYFMESLISRGSLASTQIPVLTNAAAGLCTQCASSSSSPPLNASHDKQGDPVALPKCVSGGVGHSITERRAHFLQRPPDTCDHWRAFHRDCWCVWGKQH